MPSSKEYIRQYNKKYRLKNKEKLDKYYKQWRVKNREKRLLVMRRYYLKNKDKLLKLQKEYNKKNHRRRHLVRKLRLEKNMKSWESFIPLITNCQICGKEIYFNRKIIQDCICFDHKHENCAIKTNPSYWLPLHPRTPENQKIWESCDFGMLCNRCSCNLPTKNRKEVVTNINQYVFGIAQKIL
jgi:hypothetical protein